MDQLVCFFAGGLPTTQPVPNAAKIEYTSNADPTKATATFTISCVLENPMYYDDPSKFIPVGGEVVFHIDDSTLTPSAPEVYFSGKDKVVYMNIKIRIEGYKVDHGEALLKAYQSKRIVISKPDSKEEAAGKGK
jgi:hypothetical protein